MSSFFGYSIVQRAERVQNESTSFAANLVKDLARTLRYTTEPISDHSVGKIISVIEATAKTNRNDKQQYNRVRANLIMTKWDTMMYKQSQLTKVGEKFTVTLKPH